MSFKAISILLCLVLGLTSSLNLSSDINNAILVNPPTTSITGGSTSFIIRFSFPSSTANAIGPSALGSSGLNHMQFIGVAFPASVGTADLLFDQGTTPKFSCALTDGTITYNVVAVQPVTYTLIPTLVVESNIAYCRLEDRTANVPLKTGLGITYKLTITLISTKIASTNFLRSVSLFTSTTNNPEKMIIDYLPVVGTVALYNDFTAFAPKALDIMSASISVTQGPSASNAGTIVYPYNQFDVTLTLKANSFITAADNVIVFAYPTNTVTAAGTIVSNVAAPNDPLQVALKGNLALKAFGTNALYIDGITEDLIPNRQFSVSLKGWKALDTNIGTQQPLYVIVYYKNTYSELSYVASSIFLVTKDILTVTANHPESWDVYRGGAWPIAFTFKTATDLSNGGWVVIQQSDTLEQTDLVGSKVTFIASTCDFSSNDSSFDNSFGKRSNCYPLRANDNVYAGTTTTTTYNGSGIFFLMKGTLTAGKAYSVTVWAFFENCGGNGQSTTAAMNVVNSTTSYTSPTFTVYIYRTINATRLNELRFNTADTKVTQSIISQSTPTIFSGKCWNNYVFVNTALPGEHWVAATNIANTITVATTTALVGLLNYREIYDWTVFSETNDTKAAATTANAGAWYLAPTTIILAQSTATNKFIYSTTSGNVISSGSYFLAAFKTDITIGTLLDNKIAIPSVALPSAGADPVHPPGRWVWQFPAKWFTTGNGYKSSSSTCYASWSYTDTTNLLARGTGLNLLQTLFATTPALGFDYSLNTNFFGALTTNNGSASASTIDTTRSLLPPDNTTTGSANIVRLVSTYHDGASPVWKIIDYGTVSNTVITLIQIQVAFFTSCVKWVSSAPKITSLYSYIDVQIKWNYQGTAVVGQTQNEAPISNIRLIKLFPETGVFNDFTKNPNTATTIKNPMLNHVIYNTQGTESVCLLELSGVTIQSIKSTSNTLAIWIFGGVLLETDYSDASSLYPVAPLVSGIQPYGLQSGQPMDYASNPWFTPSTQTDANVLIKQSTPILYQFSKNNTSAPLTGSAAVNGVVAGANPAVRATEVSQINDWASNSSYMWFMGSVVYLTSVTTTTLTNTSSTETNFFIPYYCPRWIANMMLATGNSPSVRNAHVFPVVMAAWITASAHNSITSVDTWVTYSEGSVGFVKVIKVFANPTISTVNYSAKTVDVTAAATNQVATLKWNPYTIADTYLYVYNGSVTAANTAQICTGHSLFIHSSLTLDTTVTSPFNAGYTGVYGFFTGPKLFYVSGKPFNKAVFYGLGGTPTVALTVPSTDNMAALIADGSSYSINYYTGVKRPTVDSFVSNGQLVLIDKLAYSCSSILNAENTGISNYAVNVSGSNTVSNFILDWNKDFGTTGAWAAPSIGFDKNDVFKSDVAGNFKVVLSPPVSVPAGTVLQFTANNSLITGNTICGLIVTSGAIVSPCTTASSTTINCAVPNGGTSFTVCCYNVSITADTLSLNTVVANFPADANNTGISTYLTSTVYSAATQIGTGSTTNPFLFNTSNSLAVDVIGTKFASITAINYSQVNQEAGIGKATITINLPREPTRDMKLSIVGDFSGMVIPGNIPRCYATFGSISQYGSNWDNGDVLIDSCSASNISSATPITVITKKMVYKCGISFSKTLYISLWPVVIVNWSGTSVNNSFKVAMTLTSNDAIALSTSAFTVTLAAPVSAKPSFVGQWDTLCALSSITPKVPGEMADYQFDVDLDTNKLVLANSNPNEVTIFFPYQYFGSFMPNVLCYYSGNLNCSFSDEGILNIRFSTNLAIGSGKKISITIVGIQNPAIDVDYSFPCTVNSSNFSTGSRTNLITGSGKLAGGITTVSVTAFGALRFLQAAIPVSDKNPRNVSVHQFRVAFDNAINLTPSPLTINNTPVIHVNFPADYKLAWYTNKPSASIDEWTSDANSLITKTSTIAPASVTQSGNRVTITLSQASVTFGVNWRYWDITITNIINPTDTTIQTGPPVSQTTRSFQVTMTNSNLSALYRTYTNTNSYVSDNLPIAVDANIGWNRGNSFIFDNKKWVVDIYSTASQLNTLTIKSGRYLQAYFNIKTNTSIALSPWVTTMSLTDSVFKTSQLTYSLSTSYNQPLGFYVGCPCGSAPGYYLINFNSSDNINFSTLSPVVITVDTFTKGTISYQTPPTIPAGGSTWIGIVLSEPNFDLLAVNWVAADNSKNDATASLSNVSIAAGTITPTTTTAASMSPIFSTFAITSSSTTLGAQAFKTTDPNTCYSWNNANVISFNIQGSTAIIPNLNLATFFKYTNADNDTTVTAKNSMKFNFTPPVAPIFIYCALACINMAYPADATIIAPLQANTNYLQFYSNIISNVTPIDIIFSNLVRGQQYHLRCIIQSTQTIAPSRSTSSASLENYTPVTTTNSTVVNLIASSPTATQCAQWQFLSEPGQTTRTAVVNYCQKLFSAPGWWNNGCVICTYSDLTYNTPGLSLPSNITCATTTASSRLRFLQTTNLNPATNTTVNAASSLTVCPVAHPICSTDVTGNKVYADYFNQMISDLKTTALFQQNLNINNVNLNVTSPVLTVTDTVTPDLTKMVTGVTSSNANGAVSWTATFATSLVCYWQISSSTAPTFSSLNGCTDPSWCGNSPVGPVTTTISTTSLKAFTAGSTYQIYMGCSNNIPFAQLKSTVVSAGSFTIPATSITPVVVNTTTTSSSYVSFSMIVLLLLYFLLL